MVFIPTDDGRWVSEHYERLARVVQDYDPAFELRWIPPESRETAEERKEPYCIWDTRINKPVMYAGELDSPEDILARLWMGDNTKHNVLEFIDKKNKAREALLMKEQMDLAEERQEKIAWLMATNKNYINMGNGRVVDDQLRTVRRGH